MNKTSLLASHLVHPYNQACLFSFPSFADALKIVKDCCTLLLTIHTCVCLCLSMRAASYSCVCRWREMYCGCLSLWESSERLYRCISKTASACVFRFRVDRANLTHNAPPKAEEEQSSTRLSFSPAILLLRLVSSALSRKEASHFSWRGRPPLLLFFFACGDSLVYALSLSFSSSFVAWFLRSCSG